MQLFLGHATFAWFICQATFYWPCKFELTMQILHCNGFAAVVTLAQDEKFWEGM